jgi:hypothetical protein
MKKKKLIMIFTFFNVLIMNYVMGQTWPPYGMNGNGTENNPWQITTPIDLEALALYVNAGNGNATNGVYYLLLSDIDLSEYDNWMPIGNNNTSDNKTCFQGIFNGNSKVIKNVIINYRTDDYLGLFGSVSNANIHNLGVENVLGSRNYGNTQTR